MTVFVGRVDELAALGEVADVAGRGQVAAALVVGDPGSGKSRLLAEATARIRITNLFRVVGYEPESDFIAHYNQTAKPLKWSYTVEQLEHKLATRLIRDVKSVGT